MSELLIHGNAKEIPLADGSVQCCTPMTDWHGLYREGWGQEIVPEAFAHPAKFSRGLIRRIYQHAVEECWLQDGDVVLDPFGGVGLGSLDAMRHGLRWVGVELEQKFVDLGSENISKWMWKYSQHFPAWGSAQLLQGDSRKLLAVIGEAAGVVSSPPFGERTAYPDMERNKERQDVLGKGGTLHSSMGETEGQLAQLDSTTDDFWLAARAIVDQVYAALRPGGCAIWVVKAFVKNGERVDFPGQWRQMCEAAGFETLHQHRAWLVEQRGAQFDLNGELVEKRVERKSFFRRLAEKKGSPRIDYEVVLCQRKPLPLPAAPGGGEET